MAFFNRKPFLHELPKPGFMKPRTDAFSSVPCPPFCSPRCPDGCVHVPFPDHERADDDHYSFRRRRRHGHESLNVFVVIIIILVVLSALALCFSVMYVRILRRRRRNRRGIPIMVAGLNHARDQVDDDHHQGRDDFVVGDGMPVEHHIWYISTVGLQSSVINSIAVCKYKRDDGVVEGTVCAVCLSEFQEGESLRLLPKCNHAFHVSCIDAWLRSRTNCPLCRAPIISITTTHHPNSQLPPPLDDDHLRSARNHHLHVENNSSFRQEPEATRAGLREMQLISGKTIRRTMSIGSCLLAVSRDSHSIDIGKMSAETRGAVGNEGSSSSLPSSLMHRGLGAMKRSISCCGKLMSSS